MRKLLVLVFAVIAFKGFAEDIDLTAAIREAYEADHSLVAYSDAGHYTGEPITGYTLFDGSVAQRWLSTSDPTSWAQISLSDEFVALKGGLPAVKSFRILCHADKARRPELFTVQVSNDGVDWVEAFRAKTPRLTWGEDNSLTWTIDEPLSGKYIRFYFIKPAGSSTYAYSMYEIYLYGVFGNSVISECDGVTEQGLSTDQFKPRLFEGDSATLTAPDDFVYGGMSNVCTGHRLETSTDGGENWSSVISQEKSVTLPVGTTLYRVTWLWKRVPTLAEVDLTEEVRKSYLINPYGVAYSTSPHFTSNQEQIDNYTPYDGITNQRWLSASRAATAYFQIDLADTFAEGRMPRLTRVKLHNNNSGRRPTELEVKVSEDGENWTSVSSVTAPLTWNGNFAEFDVPGKAVGRHFRLEMTKSSGGTAEYLYDIEEIYLYGKYVTSGLMLIIR